MTYLRSYSELIKRHDFVDRFEYLVLRGHVGDATFGHDRYINQDFYRSTEWRNVRNHVIARDNGCDLGVPGFDIHTELVVHHINPMTADDIVHGLDWILDPEFLITTCQDTHNAIHYGGNVKVIEPYVARFPGDTRLW